MFDELCLFIMLSYFIAHTVPNTLTDGSKTPIQNATEKDTTTVTGK